MLQGAIYKNDVVTVVFVVDFQETLTNDQHQESGNF